MSVVTGVAARDSPYKGLTPFGREDAAFFVGREDETRIITANLLACRLTLLYGPSGVGKSSLLAAGVIPTLDALTRENIEAGGGPGHITVSFPSDAAGTGDRRASWRDDPIRGIADAIREAVARFGLDAPARRANDMTGLLERWAGALDADILLVLDQFEEYFLYHGDEQGENTLAEQLPRIVGLLGLPVNVLISIREDAYTRLDRFKGRIPSLYDNYLRVGHLTREGGRRAIEEPVSRYNGLIADPERQFGIGPGLTDAVLHEVRSGAVVLGQSGRGTVDENGGSATGIETPFLQLVLERLWEEAREDGSRTLRLDTLERLGHADRIVRSHLDAAMTQLSVDSQDAAARVFGRLVTPSRSKIAALGSDLAAMESLPQAQVLPMLEQLANQRVLRPVAPPPGSTEPRYEIFHDVLAPAILDWRARWLQGREDAERRRRLEEDLERQESQRRLAQEQAEHDRELATRSKRVASVAGICAIVAAVGAIAALVMWHRAKEEHARANVSELVRNAESALASDPAKALALAARAVTQERDRNGGPSPAAVAALRHALGASHLVAVLKPRTAVSFAAFSPKTGQVVTAGGDRLDVWATTDGANLGGVDIGDGVLLRAAFSPDAKTVVAGTADGRTLAWRVGADDVKVLGTSKGQVVQLGVAPGGVVVAKGARDDSVRLFRLTGGAGPARIDLHSSPTVEALSPDGRLLLAGNRKHPPRVYSTRTGHVIRVLDWQHKVAPTGAAAFSRDGRQIAIAIDRRARHRPTGFRVIGAGGREAAAAPEPDTTRRSIRVWDVKGGKALATRGVPATVTSVAFSPSGAQLVIGGDDGTARTWRPGAASNGATLQGHGDRISSVAYSDDGRWIVTAGHDGTARLWSAATGAPLAKFVGHTDWVDAAAFGARDTRVLTQSDDGSARIWRLPLAVAEAELPGTPPEEGPATGPDGRWILLGTGDTAKVYDLAKATLLRAIDRNHAWFAGLSRSGRVVLTADPRHLGAWSADTGKAIVHKKLSVGGPPTESDDGRWLLVRNHGYRPWDAETGALHAPLPSSEAVDFGIALSPNGQYAAGRGRAGRLQLWNVAAGTAVGRQPKVPAGVLAVSPDGKQVAVARPDSGGIGTPSPAGVGSVTTLWDTATGRGRNLVLRTHGDVSAIRFSPDGSLILTVSDDENAARVWDARDGHPVATLRGHTGAIAAARFDAGSRLVATASSDGSARVWDIRSGDQLEEFRPNDREDLANVSFDATASHVIVSTFDRVAVYPCDMCGGYQQLLDLAAKHRPT